MNKNKSKVKSHHRQKARPRFWRGKSKLRKIFYPFWAIFGLLFLALILLPKQTLAVETSSYDPYNVIPNEIFINETSMTAAQIESFMLTKGGYYKNYTIPEYITVPFPYRDGAGNPKWSTVKVRQRNIGNGLTGQLWGKKVSKLIYDECRSHNINPQLVLVMMQKESSIITQNSPDSVTKTWPMFYAFNESMASFNYSYNEAKAQAQSYGGVGQQLARSIWWLRIYYDEADEGSIGATCDGANMDAANIASQVLYLYTPHSQYNVWRLMQDWFAGGVASYPFAKVPNTSLLKKDSYYYLCYDDAYYRLGATSLSVRAYGYITTEAQISTLAGLSNGGNLSNYIQDSGGNKFYIAGGLKYYIWPSSVFKTRWGFSSRTPITNNTIAGIIPNAPRSLSGFVKPLSSYNYYFIDNGGKRYKVWPSSTFWNRWGLKSQDLVVLPDAIVSAMPSAGYLSGIVKGQTSNQAYYIDRGGKRYPIWPSSVFWERWGFRYTDAVRISNAQLNYMAKTKWLTGLVRNESSGQLYYVDNSGTKYKIPLGSYFWTMWGFRVSDVSIISNSQLAYMRYGGVLSLYVKGNMSPSVCRISGNSCPLVYPGSNPVSVLTQGQFDYLRR